MSLGENFGLLGGGQVKDYKDGVSTPDQESEK